MYDSNMGIVILGVRRSTYLNLEDTDFSLGFLKNMVLDFKCFLFNCKLLQIFFRSKVSHEKLTTQI